MLHSTLKPLITPLLDSLVDNTLHSLALMPRCYLCGTACQRYWALCNNCHQALPVIPKGCPICAIALDNNASCGDCLKNPKPYIASYCSLSYQNPVSYLIHAFKHQNAWAIGQHLCQHWLHHNNATIERVQHQTNTLIVPVPSHKKPIMSRGYTPASYIAQYLARTTRLPYAYLLRSHLHTAQKSLNRAERLRNLTGMFFTADHSSKNSLCEGQHVVLVDDVITSCATAIAASQTLLQAGARSVEVWAIARTPMH
ncbi:ComF family protein [Marinagarivorans algicola]|uniref:ComF family protein n=1 Tax=Marinagarivorans algicola TaxID=1513270 RepID=UPI0006B65E80|nr:ComF family protein [Marinagarivorans algicola]